MTPTYQLHQLLAPYQTIRVHLANGDAEPTPDRPGASAKEVAMRMAPSTCRTGVAMAYDESSVLVVTPQRRRR